MNCWKCTNPAVVHLTDVVTEAQGRKRCVEIHLCVIHALESGFLAHLPTPAAAAQNPKKSAAVEGAEPAAAGGSTVIQPTTPAKPAAMVPLGPAGGLSVVRKSSVPGVPAVPACPVCGLTYAQFKATGLMGCPHDYTFFEARLLPVIKRAQENALQHAGKIPTRVRHVAPDHAAILMRLRRELDHALQMENYEQAAQLRDRLKARPVR